MRPITESSSALAGDLGEPSFIAKANCDATHSPLALNAEPDFDDWRKRVVKPAVRAQQKAAWTFRIRNPATGAAVKPMRLSRCSAASTPRSARRR